MALGDPIIEETNGAIVKATVLEGLPDDSRLALVHEDDAFYAAVGDAIPAPYDPEQLCLLYEQSSSLRPNIDALVTNVDSFGHTLVPTIDLTAPDADEKIRDSLLVEALYDGVIVDLSKEVVTQRRMELEAVERIERLRTKLFLDSVCPDMTFVELRMQTRNDREITGNAYWEILRNRMGEIGAINYVPSTTMRLVRMDAEIVTVRQVRRVSDVSYRLMEERRRFRRFVQWKRGMAAVYFKEFGDPRTISARSGRIYENETRLQKAEGEGAIAASEILHFKIHSPRSVYGIPRWIGAFLAIIGTRDSEEVNVTYFRNKAVPPLAILVSGGVLKSGTADRINTYIRDNIKGKDNFHSILILEAEGSGGAALSSAQGSRVRIEIKNLQDAQHDDALFQKYEERNDLKVGAQFRIPKFLRGDADDVNRATSGNVIRTVEQQVFQPERSAFDYVMNEKILLDRGVCFLRLVSKGPDEKNLPEVIEMLERLVVACIITPNEARELAAETLGKRLDKVQALWARIPPKMAELGFVPEPTPEELEGAEGRPEKPDIKLAPTDAAQVMTVNEARASIVLGPKMKNGAPDPDGEILFSEWVARQQGAGAPTLDQQARSLVSLRDALKEAEGKFFAASRDEAAKQEAETVVHVPKEEFDSWFVEQDR